MSTNDTRSSLMHQQRLIAVTTPPAAITSLPLSIDTIVRHSSSLPNDTVYMYTRCA
eukprot:CAMPEP_0201719268 /NCGR_PEP_ID=MMETSP0593-20130828/4503_1 /ASSEMBLY_ACC=CAM_ASM_000672 /TAXON_ID=267983 /ORGANISM="Skeletonema japonicum, Strain CCMP2506" /LENGTH=55 /DNA_ID=CAMNT_0048209667 /DNA_START=124 /DNA_END=288 /DNA_ORIENTATION=-